MDGLTRYDELWFEDGNIVLVVDHTALRVHRSLLARKSTVFSDMLSLPQAYSQELVDGAPVIHMHDDPQDLVYFIDSMYNGMK